jgi:preprotein translocase subunit SecA
VLNAKQHEREAYVVAQAGRKGAITVATNMAGRGTDIILGGNPEMLAKLRDASRSKTACPRPSPRSSRSWWSELRGASSRGGRRGGARRAASTSSAPSGTSRAASTTSSAAARAARAIRAARRFYLSLEDDLMRIFAGDRVKNLMERMGMPDDEPIEHPWVTKSVENAQKKVEERNFDIRKNLLEYDDVMNAQRKTIYELRQQLLFGRYEPDMVDEEGKPTGEKRVIKPLARS